MSLSLGEQGLIFAFIAEIICIVVGYFIWRILND